MNKSTSNKKSKDESVRVCNECINDNNAIIPMIDADECHIT